MHKWNQIPNGFSCEGCGYKVLHILDPETERGTRHVPKVKEIHINRPYMTTSDADFQTVVWGIRCMAEPAS